MRIMGSLATTLVMVVLAQATRYRIECADSLLGLEEPTSQRKVDDLQQYTGYWARARHHWQDAYRFCCQEALLNVLRAMSRWPLFGFLCFCLLSWGSRTAHAKAKVPIERAEGPVDQTVYDRGLVVEDVKARDILQACPPILALRAVLPSPPQKRCVFHLRPRGRGRFNDAWRLLRSTPVRTTATPATATSTGRCWPTSRLGASCCAIRARSNAAQACNTWPVQLLFWNHTMHVSLLQCMCNVRPNTSEHGGGSMEMERRCRPLSQEQQRLRCRHAMAGEVHAHQPGVVPDTVERDGIHAHRAA